MSIPTATWRVQFRNGMTFDRVIARVPYLKKLGISHLYASPIFTATTGSTHGYDVTRCGEIDPVLGGREGFDRLVNALKAAGMGLVLDIVPNHMAASLENPWWRDVIRHGEKSRYARHFDIDWTRRLTLPFLGDSFENALQNGEISVKPDPHTGEPALAYYDSYYPLDPTRLETDATDILKLTDPTAITALHARQPWELLCWREAPHTLSWRRFFEITGLVGMRVEDPLVFDETHTLIIELVRSGAVDGLRIDHIDGLADPGGYLDTLRHSVGPGCWITVEKILGEGEHLPAKWPVSGTTGYEFIASLSDALVDGDKTHALFDAYEKVLDKTVDMDSELRKAKLLMVDRNFEGEFTRLLALSMAVAKTEAMPPSETPVRAVLRELLVSFPVYRTYGTAQGLPVAERARLDAVADTVRHSANAPHPEALDFVLRIMSGEVAEEASDDATAFRLRFQQLTGPLMAKSVEDTLFFRQHAALALNEVGAEPLPRDYAVARFHADMQIRQAQQPDALSTTSTHDTKRGEDTRARLYTLTEAPGYWADAVIRWREMNQSAVALLEDGPAPRSGSKWMVYQALAGAWPVTLQPDDKAGLYALAGRFLPYVEKALREEKLRTRWDDTNDAYEQAVLGYVRHLLSNQPFLRDFVTTIQPFIRAGLVNSLSQTVIKLAAPGVPDIYQGSEGLDFSLVDPDNRREPDFSTLEDLLNRDDVPLFANDIAWQCGQVKQHVIARLLHLRQHKSALFREGDYLPLPVHGHQARHALAFARLHGNDLLLVIVPRLVFSTGICPLSHAHLPYWIDAEIRLPAALIGRRVHDLFSGTEIVLTGQLLLSTLDSSASVVVLSN